MGLLFRVVVGLLVALLAIIGLEVGFIVRGSGWRLGIGLMVLRTELVFRF